MSEPDYSQPPPDVLMIRAGIRAVLDQKDGSGTRVGSSRYGVYAFYDYDEEPIYVGQTRESLSQRISRHMTNQRTDAVAMSVLDPFEVAYIEVWPLNIGDAAQIQSLLDRTEYTVYQKLLAESKFGAVLNEAIPHAESLIDLPKSYRGRIVPDDVFGVRRHPDTRIARRALTIANLAKVISERNVSQGLRVTLLTQSRRLEDLARRRLEELGITRPPTDTEVEAEGAAANDGGAEAPQEAEPGQD